MFVDILYYKVFSFYVQWLHFLWVSGKRSKEIAESNGCFYFQGSVIGVAAPSPDAAAALVVPVILPLLIFAGFFINSR